MDRLYSFVYRGQLVDASLDKAGRKRQKSFEAQDREELAETLCMDLIDEDLLVESQRMAVVYTAVHAFENTVRQFVMEALTEQHEENWWSQAPKRIKRKVANRMEEDEKFKWHGSRGATEINYCDFGDLSSVIVTNWSVFEDILTNREWVKQLFDTLEKSRNIIMHGGSLNKEDVERIGVHIRDWVRQAG